MRRRRPQQTPRGFERWTLDIDAEEFTFGIEIDEGTPSAYGLVTVTAEAVEPHQITWDEFVACWAAQARLSVRDAEVAINRRLCREVVSGLEYAHERAWDDECNRRVDAARNR